MTWHHPTEIEAEELKKKYHEEKQDKGTSNKENKHSLKKCAGIDVRAHHPKRMLIRIW
jgi:hypothetical protein